MPSKSIMRAADKWIIALADEPIEVTHEIVRRLTRSNPMPSKSPKQARTMRAAAHDPAFSKKMGIPQKVAREYVAADQKKSPKPAKRK